MILLDTNVVSEPLKPRPDPAVVAWLDRQVVETLHLSTVTVAELRFGIAALSEGRRKRDLSARFEESVLPVFGRRIHGFDLAASAAYADIRATARAEGRAIGAADAFVAAIASVHGFTVATRDVSGFEAAGLPVIDPFRAGSSHPAD